MRFLVLFILIINFSLNAQVHWVKIGQGLNYGVTNNQKGNDILVTIGGWKANQTWVNKWCEELFNVKLKELGVQHLISVKGPDDVCFNLKNDIDIKTLAEFIKNIIYATYFIDKVIIIAHSSGSFVAHDLLNFMYAENGIAKDSFYINKVHYFNLDGGIGGKDCGISLDTSAVKHLSNIYAVAVYDSSANLFSANYETMKRFYEMYYSKSELLTISTAESGCVDKWCLHNAVIINKPHNPNMYDLEKDYQNFNDTRKVQTDYLKVFLKE